jgi:mRNA interferase MazF
VSIVLGRGSVVTVRFNPAVGLEIRKTRPAVVVSNDVACRFDSVIQVVPVTQLPDRPLRPYESRVDSPSSGIARPSRAVANQIRTISKVRVGEVIGVLSDRELRDLDQAMRIQLALG